MAHIHEKIDFTVEVFIVCDGKVLLRRHDKYGIWLGVGGHIELDEEPTEAALREVKEEVGLNVEIIDHVGIKNIPEAVELNHRQLIPPRFLNIHPISESHRHIGMVYFAISKSNNVVPEKPTDVWKWFDFESLEKNEEGVSPEIIFYAKGALNVASGNS